MFAVRHPTGSVGEQHDTDLGVIVEALVVMLASMVSPTEITVVGWNVGLGDLNMGTSFFSEVLRGIRKLHHGSFLKKPPVALTSQLRAIVDQWKQRLSFREERVPSANLTKGSLFHRFDSRIPLKTSP
jgi:hypothetical protein